LRPTRAAFASRLIVARERGRTQTRHQEIVDATKIALVSQPAQQWTLAQVVDTSRDLAHPDGNNVEAVCMK